LICIGMGVTVSKINPECPHCGYRFDYRSIDSSNEYTCDGAITTYSVTCAACDFCTGQCDSEEAARKEWNLFERKGTFMTRLVTAGDHVCWLSIVVILASVATTTPIGVIAIDLVGAIYATMLTLHIVAEIAPLVKEHKNRSEMRRFEKAVSQWRKNNQ